MIHNMLYEYVTNPDTKNNFFLQNNYLVPGILTAYVLFTTVLGRFIMDNRRPMNLKYTIILFNGVLVASNAYFVIFGWPALIHAWPSRCEISNTEYYKIYYKKHENLFWQCFLVKFTELFDTVFFVLRKKYNQITFLHVFHHFSVCAGFWYLIRRQDIPFYIMLLGALNCSVHVLMYLYYGLSAFGHHMQKYLWWKNYLTTIQIVQFLIVLTYTGTAILTGCDAPTMFGKIFFWGLILFTGLFLRFYFNTYFKTNGKDT